MAELAIRQVAERTGIAAGTIRMWEQRYGFPDPERTASGYRRYSDEDVDALRRVASFRQMGLSIPAAIDRVRGASEVPDKPSIYAAVAGIDEMARPQVLRKATLEALSLAIEDETLASAESALLFGAFQVESAFRPVEHRWRRLARQADAATVFAEFAEPRLGGPGPAELPIDRDDAIGNEWALVVDAPGYCACLAAWEHPSKAVPMGPDDDRRRFEAIWTVHPRAVRRAAEVATRLAGTIDPGYGSRLEGLLTDRPLAMETPSPALTSLTNRAIAYMDQRL